MFYMCLEACHGWYSSRGSFQSCNTLAHWQILVAVDLVSGVFWNDMNRGHKWDPFWGDQTSKCMAMLRGFPLLTQNSALFGVGNIVTTVTPEVANNLSNSPVAGELGFDQTANLRKADFLTILLSIVKSSEVAPELSNPTNHHYSSMAEKMWRAGLLMFFFELPDSFGWIQISCRLQPTSDSCRVVFLDSGKAEGKHWQGIEKSPTDLLTSEFSMNRKLYEGNQVSEPLMYLDGWQMSDSKDCIKMS